MFKEERKKPKRVLGSLLVHVHAVHKTVGCLILNFRLLCKLHVTFCKACNDVDFATDSIIQRYTCVDLKQDCER